MPHFISHKFKKIKLFILFWP